MSYDEKHFGKIRLLTLADGQSTNDLCKELCEKNNYEFSSYHDDYIECLKDNGYEKYLVTENGIYEIFEHKEVSDDPYVQKLIPLGDGTFEFVATFYNGGTCLSEILEDELENYEQNKSKEVAR